MNIVEALDDPDLFQGMFDGPSWKPWRAFLTALSGLPMDDDTLAIYRHHTGRTAPPTAPFRAATLICGRRGGKTRALSLIATFLATVPDHSRYLVPGETAVVAVIAMNRQQARVAYNYIVGLLRSVPALEAMVVDVLAETVRLCNGVTIEIHTASIGAPRGRTFLAVLCDEAAFWPAGESSNPDEEVITAVRPGLATIPYSLLLIASSPYARRGVLYRDYARYFAKDGAPCLVWRGSTEEMNCTLVGDELIAQMYEEDPDRAQSEFGAQFRSDIVAFIARESVEAVLAHGVRELPPGGGIAYQAFTDPSGGSADAFTLAIAHMGSDGVAVLDALREQRPPFSPDEVVRENAALLKSYGISRVCGDAYAGEWPRERFAAYGVAYDVSKRNKSTIYADFLPALNSQRVRLLDNPRLVGQLCNLERRTARGGRDSIDHQPGSSDDVANAAAGVLTEIIADRRPALIRPAHMLEGDVGVPLPVWCDQVFATVIVDQAGMVGTVYFAASQYYGHKLIIVDFDAEPMAPDLFASAYVRLDELARQCRSRYQAVSIWVDEAMRGHGEAQIVASVRSRLLMRDGSVRDASVQAIPKELLAAPERLAHLASGHVVAGAVRLASCTVEKMRTSPLGGALEFRAGDPLDAPLRLAALCGIVLALEDQRAVRRAA